MINATEWAKNNPLDKTQLVELISKSNQRHFNVIEQYNSNAVGVWIERIEPEVDYSVFENGQEKWYGNQNVEEFVALYLSQCDVVAIHWTVNA